MKQPDKINAVGRMQKYILAHFDEEITMDDLGHAAGYSKYHAARIFKELTGSTPYEVIRALRLTGAAETLRDMGGKIIDVALQSGFDSHDGFTRAFIRRFGITPQKYTRETPPVPYYIDYPVSSHCLLKNGDVTMEKEKLSRIVTVTAVQRPVRKLILLRAKETKNGDYLAYCEEMGCEWEGLLNSIPEKYAPAALLTLPPSLIKQNTSDTAAGIEVPPDYIKSLPGGYDLIDLSPCTMLFFSGPPYENEDDFCVAIELVQQALDCYNPGLYGWRAAPELAPRFNFGASGALGARMAVPVKEK